MTLFGYALIVLLLIGFIAYAIGTKGTIRNEYQGQRLPDQPENFGGVDEYDLYIKK